MKNRYIAFSFILIIIIGMTFFLYKEDNKTVYVYYSANNNIEYEVYLKDNKYFDKNYLSSNKQYVVDILDYIEVKYNAIYKYSQKTTANYQYEIFATANIINNKNDKVLYEIKEELFKSDIEKIKKNYLISIQKKFKIDYTKYNDKIRSFVTDYELKDIKTNLAVNIVLKINGNKNYNDNANITINMPLNETTFDLTSTVEDVDKNKNYYSYKLNGKYNVFYIIIIITCIILLFVIIYKSFFDKIINIIKFNLKSNNKKEINKINKQYGPFIHKLERFNLNLYNKKIKIENIDDLIDIKDTINKPIFMKETKTTINYFIIDNNDLLYIYSIKIN